MLCSLQSKIHSQQQRLLFCVRDADYGGTKGARALETSVDIAYSTNVTNWSRKLRQTQLISTARIGINAFGLSQAEIDAYVLRNIHHLAKSKPTSSSQTGSFQASRDPPSDPQAFRTAISRQAILPSTRIPGSLSYRSLVICQSNFRAYEYHE